MKVRSARERSSSASRVTARIAASCILEYVVDAQVPGSRASRLILRRPSPATERVDTGRIAARRRSPSAANRGRPARHVVAREPFSSAEAAMRSARAGHRRNRVFNLIERHWLIISHARSQTRVSALKKLRWSRLAIDVGSGPPLCKRRTVSPLEFYWRSPICPLDRIPVENHTYCLYTLGCVCQSLIPRDSFESWVHTSRPSSTP